jgi:uncharacterized membrane protein YbhN (UPF0104 family)
VQPSLSNENEEYVSKISLESVSEPRIPTKNYRTFLAIIKFVVGLALLVLAVRGIQFDNLVNGIRSSNLTWLSLTLSVVLLGLALKLWRWFILVRDYRIQASLGRCFSAYFVGQAANIVLPFRGGEVIRLGYFVEEKEIIPAAASTIILEKYLDLLALTVSCILVSLKLSLDNVLNLRGFLLPVTLLTTMILTLAVLCGPSLWEKIRGRTRLPQGLVVWLDRWVQASRWLRNPAQLIPVVLLTGLIWGIMWLTNLLLFRSLGLHLSGIAGGLVLVLVYIGLLPALMPGNIGPFYFFASLALLPFGILHETAVSYAILLHALVTLPPLLGGVIGLLIHSQPASIS